VDIASRCNVKVERIPNPFPAFKVPEGHTPRAILIGCARRIAARLPQLERQAQQASCGIP